MKVLGIDPGLSGGIAYLAPFCVHVSPMPETERDLFRLLAQFKKDGVDRTLIEQAQARPGQAKTHVFFQNYGFLRGVLCALEIPYEAVSAQKWQSGIMVGRRPKTRAERWIEDQIKAAKTGRKKTALKKKLNPFVSKRKRAHKNALKQKAQELFPSTPVTLKTCDALLIAEYARRTIRIRKRERL